MASQLYYRSLSDQGPYKFLFYIVAGVGRRCRHRPVAVALRDDSEVQDHRFGGTRVIDACLRTIKLLSAPSNRAAVEAELELATAFYKDGDGVVARSHLPEDEESQSEGGIFGMAFEEEPKTDRPWDDTIREFPFISTCLLLGLAYDPSRSRAYSPRTEQLGMAFKDDALHHGMVIVDISDLNDIRYGIIAFTLRHMAEVSAPPYREYDPVEDEPPEDDPELTLEEDRPRKPLSAVDYIQKFHYRDSVGNGRLVKELELQYRVIEPQAMDFIWPGGDIESGNDLPQHGNVSNSLSQQAIKALIDGTRDVEKYDMSTLNEVLVIPDFKKSLRQHVQNHPEGLGPTVAAGQLLRLASEGDDHLNWVRFKCLSYEGVAAALESTELQGASSISLCIDRMQGNPETLFEAFCRLENLVHICLLQEPERANDTESTRIFLILQKRDYVKLLCSRVIVITAPYSAPLRKQIWLPTTGHAPPVEAYPAQQMFVRHELQKPVEKFRPNYFYLGDGLIGPERFVAGFLSYIRSLCDDEHLFCFSCALSSLGEPSKVRTNPILAEIFSVSANSITTRGTAAGTSGEYWNKPRDLEQGTWTVVISVERNDELDLRSGEDEPPPWARPPAAPLLRYAFIQAQRRVSISGHQSPRTVLVEPDNIKVCDLVGFLIETAPHVSSSLAEELLGNVANEIAEKTLESRRSQGKPPPLMRPGVDWVSALDTSTACSILEDFLTDASYARSNLALDTAEKPDDCN